MSARKTCRSVAIYIYVRLLHIVELFFLIYVKTTLWAFYCNLGPQAYKDDFVERGLYKLHCWGHRNISKTKKKKNPKPLKIKKKRNIKWKFFKINTLNSLYRDRLCDLFVKFHFLFIFIICLRWFSFPFLSFLSYHHLKPQLN